MGAGTVGGGKRQLGPEYITNDPKQRLSDSLGNLKDVD